MIRSAGKSNSASNGQPRELLFLALVLAGLSINLYLLSRYIAEAGIAGCGGGPCELVLASRWSTVFGVPVTVLGALVYVGLIASHIPSCRWLTGPLLGAVLGSVFWFVFAQAVLIGKFCPWCLAAHGVGVAVVRVGAARLQGGLSWWAYAAFLAIGLAQIYGPVPATHRMEGSVTPVAWPPVHAGGGGRKVFFDGGRKSFNVGSFPRIGSPEAKHVLVEYFDFQCPSCRIMGGYLAALVEKHPDDICVLLMPVPLDPVCNDGMVFGDTGHPDSCELTHIALAVWRVDPDAYPELHRALLSDPPPGVADALALARKLVPGAKLDAAMEEPWIEQLIASNVADWMSFSGKTKQLPKLLVRDKRILHGLPSGKDEFLRAMEQELGL